MEKDAIARERAILAAVSDPSSTYYKGLVKLLRNCDAEAKRARQVTKHVTIPFELEESEVLELETQFSVPIRMKGIMIRARLTRRVAAMMHLLDAALMEHASAGGRVVLYVDGDVVTMAAVGLDGVIVERSRATPRLLQGYFLEDEQLRANRTKDTRPLGATSELLLREMEAGGGEHFFPKVRDQGPRVDVIVINHFKTPIGLAQVAWLAHLRGAAVLGTFPFQIGMLTRESGSLECFPGKFYIDKEADTMTLVPSDDASMSISMPYSSFLGLARNGSVTVGGREFLCERYMCLRGILYYSLKPVDVEFEVVETLRFNYFDVSAVGLTRLSYPRVKFSREGVPIGFERDSVVIETGRLERVMGRAMTSSSSVVQPAEVFVALMDYNNMVVNTLDTAVLADRMSFEEEQGAAIAIALHVNWTRHNARATLNTLLDLVKLRYKVADVALHKLAFVAMAAWWSRPSISQTVASEIPLPTVLDWCGNDFTVVMRDVDPWIEIAQEVGGKVETESRYFPWFPQPPRDSTSSWYQALLERARGVVGTQSKPRVWHRMSMEKKPVRPTVYASVVNVMSVPPVKAETQLTTLKQTLLSKMMREQNGTEETVGQQEMEVMEHMSRADIHAEVIEVDPKSAMLDDIDMLGGFARDNASTGYRLAEVEADVAVRGSIGINDAKRNLPKEKWVRLSSVDLGVEGTRPASQASLFAALKKRNIGIPSNRGTVNLDLVPHLVVEKVIKTCYRDGWQAIVERHLNTGLWEANESDLESFLGKIDEIKAKRMLDEFFLEGTVNFERWMLMAKGKVKPSREADADAKVDHAQTIMFLESNSTNAMYSSMVRRFKKVVDECLRGDIRLNAQESDEEHEIWYNSMENVRRSMGRTYNYSADIKCYDRSQEYVGQRLHLEFYRRHGLSPERLAKWEEIYGTKRAVSMMFGIILVMVMGGISGIFDTLWRNGIINLAALIHSAEVNRSDIVMIDIKGDDMEAEFKRPVAVESTVERLSLTFNFSAKFFTSDIRYMCKQFRIRINGWWYHIADPWARAQSACTPMVIDSKSEVMMERWVSLCADLRHYDNGILVEAVAEAAAVYYNAKRPLTGFSRSLARFLSDRSAFFSFFSPPQLIK